MKRGSNCIIRTINLADPWTCTRPKPLQKLVKLNVKEPCPRFRAAAAHSPYLSPRPVAVRVCTWKDMQRVCPRKPCNWKPPVRPTTFGDRLRSLLFLSIQGGIVLAMLYSIKRSLSWRELGVYELYYQAMSLILPPAIDELEQSDVNKSGFYDLEQVVGSFRPNPATDHSQVKDLKQSAVRLYNRVVFNTLGMLAALPLKLDRELRNILHGKKERRRKARSPQFKSELGERGESGET